MVKYKTEYGYFYSDKIIKIEIEKETETSVWIKGRRYNKHTQYENYWDSWEEAHSFIIQKAILRVESTRVVHERAIIELDNIKGLKKPD